MAKKATIYYGGFLQKAGGAFHHARMIDEELSRLGWHVRTITLDDLPLWCRYLPHVAEKLVNKVYRPFGFLAKGALTRRLYRQHFATPGDLRIFEDIYLAWDSMTPSVSLLHALWSDNLHAFPSSPRREASFRSKEARIINRIQQPIITVSTPYRDYIVDEHLSEQLTRDIQVVELGINQSLSTPQTSVRVPKSIIYTGTLEARKNPRFLLEVLQSLHKRDKRYTLTVVGDGPLRAELETFVNEHKLPVSFLGRIDNTAVLARLREHEFYVHSSVKESFSFSLLEAKIAGLVTCAFAELQVPSEFIDLKCAEFSPETWASAILYANSTPPPFDGSKYTAERMTQATLDVVNQLRD